MFYEGIESATDEERSGRPATSRTEENIAKIRQIVRENHQMTVRSIAVQVNIDTDWILCSQPSLSKCSSNCLEYNMAKPCSHLVLMDSISTPPAVHN
jgi:hypothetical protein